MKVDIWKGRRDLVPATHVPSNVWADRFAHYRGADQDRAEGNYFEFYGEWHDLGEFMRVSGHPYWHGWSADSIGCGVVVRVVDGGEGVIAGTWYA